MLTVTVPGRELFDESSNSFIYLKETQLKLEHSLVSISKWESKWHKPFISKDPKTTEEILDYIKCMTVTQNVPDDVYLGINDSIVLQVKEYIEDSMTATWFNDKNDKQTNKEVITSELIYYWMIAQQIPFECEKWHLNRLLTLIRICGIKNSPKKNYSKKDTFNQNKALNEARRAAMHSKG